MEEERTVAIYYGINIIGAPETPEKKRVKNTGK